MQAGKRKISQRLLLIVIMAGALMISAVAWFALANRSRSEDLEIEMPPVIYIKDDNLREMTSFDLDGLQINKTYNALFCVAPAYEGAVTDFDLGVIYTENIGMIIDLYPVQSITAAAMSDEVEVRTLNGQQCYFNYTTFADGSNNPLPTITYTKEGKAEETYQQTHLNRGVYKIYEHDKQNQGSKEYLEFTQYKSEGSTILDEINNTEKYRFYVLQVTWKENISEAELEKETDVVYIVTQGGTKRGA